MVREPRIDNEGKKTQLHDIYVIMELGRVI